MRNIEFVGSSRFPYEFLCRIEVMIFSRDVYEVIVLHNCGRCSRSRGISKASAEVYSYARRFRLRQERIGFVSMEIDTRRGEVTTAAPG